ncbi:MAG: MBL fold metallo-hydrolase [Vicinamibacterales bacterium]|nr:MBL fold metallo-hydrolase [Vicinamibacterales bacterium]
MTGAGNVTWLIPGREPLLVDAGTGQASHLMALDEALDGTRLAYVVVTHNHSDHASGVMALASRDPQLPFSKVPWPEKDPRYTVPWRPLADGDVLDAGDTTLEVIHTPGHAPDHICLWHRETRTLISGDLALAHTTVVVPASAQGDMAAYLQSLERVLALAPARMLPAHGPIIEEPEKLLRAYLRHRYAREADLLQRLAAGPVALPLLVAAIYPALPEAIRPSAGDGLLAHLIKLEREGRAARDGDVWRAAAR